MKLNVISDFAIMIRNIIDETISQSDFEDLTFQQLHYLCTINRLKNPSISELAKELNLSKPTVTVLVEKLSEREYIRKVKSDEDRRFQHLHMNTKGMKINSVYEIAAEKIHNIFKEKLSETEFEILLILISKIV